MTLDVETRFYKQFASFLSLEPPPPFFHCNLQAPPRVHARVHALFGEEVRESRNANQKF